MNVNDIDFTGLSIAQQTVMTLQGWTPSMAASGICPQPSREAMRPLIDRGLIVEHEVTSVRGGIPMTWWEYEVPIPVHMAWCLECDEHYTKAGKPKRRRK